MFRFDLKTDRFKDLKITLNLLSIFKLTNWNARVAKLVDALPSGGSVRKDVLVRIQSRAQI